jgi:alpha-mannosidase
MVKAAFPVDVNTNKATYEVQFGNIERLHTENTSWDIARFETCAHKWADISDNGYGMALMNDCKYGYSVVDGSTIQLSLLKSANTADEILVGAAAAPVNDIGTHTFTYSVVPHRGSYSDGGIVKKAYALNNPMIAARTGGSGNLPQSFSFVKADKDNIIIDTVKKAEDSSNIIIRMYEAENKKTRTNISFGVDVKRCYICDLLENKADEVEIKDGVASINVNNFEIVTLMAEI